jgi:hypothetical protein
MHPHVSQWSRIAHPEIDSYKAGQLVFGKVAKEVEQRENILSTNDAGITHSQT